MTPHLAAQALNPGVAVLEPMKQEFLARGGAEAVDLLTQAVNHESTFFLRALRDELSSMEEEASPAEVYEELLNAATDAFKTHASARG